MNYIKLSWHILIFTENIWHALKSLVFWTGIFWTAKNHPKAPDGLVFLWDAAIAAP